MDNVMFGSRMLCIVVFGSRMLDVGVWLRVWRGMVGAGWQVQKIAMAEIHRQGQFQLYQLRQTRISHFSDFFADTDLQKNTL